MRILNLSLALVFVIACQSKPDKAATVKTKDTVAKNIAAVLPSATPLKDRIETYLQLNRELKFEALMDYIYPGLFKIVPRDQLVQAIGSVFNTPGLEVKMDSLALLSIDPVTQFSKGECTKFDYAIVLRLKIDAPPGQPSAAQNKAALLQSLRSSLGTRDVAYDESTGYFTARAKKSALAINDDVSNGWKFMALENNAQLKSALPAEVVQKYF